MTNIYIGNCSYDVTEKQLRELFATYGEVESVTVVMDRAAGRDGNPVSGRV